MAYRFRPASQLLSVCGLVWMGIDNDLDSSGSGHALQTGAAKADQQSVAIWSSSQQRVCPSTETVPDPFSVSHETEKGWVMSMSPK